MVHKSPKVLKSKNPINEHRSELIRCRMEVQKSKSSKVYDFPGKGQSDNWITSNSTIGQLDNQTVSLSPPHTTAPTPALLKTDKDRHSGLSAAIMSTRRSRKKTSKKKRQHEKGTRFPRSLARAGTVQRTFPTLY